MKAKIMLSALAVFTAGTMSARADAVLDWNLITANTALAPGARPGATAILDFAVVQAAIHDTVQAYDHRFETYAITLNGDGSMDAAIATAAHDILVNRFPGKSASLNATYDA